MQNFQFSWMTLGLATSLLFGVTACQPQAANSPEPKPNEVKPAQQTNQQATIAPKSAIVSTPSVDAKTCLTLSKSMQKIDDTSKIEDIYSIQKILETCLPTTNNAEVLNLLKDYQAMYDRFLSPNDNQDISYQNDEQFYNVMTKLDEGKKVPKEQLATLAPRLRYLVELVESDADIEVIYLGEGYYEFNHNLQAMADIFTPYLRKDQSELIQRLAKDNQGIFWFDAGIAISFTEIIERALFWEDYTQRYPNGYAIADAKNLFAIYRYVLFFGSENTQWTDDNSREFYNAEDAKAIRQLAKRSNSVLGQDARHLLEFMTISDDEREQTYPVPETDSNGNEIQDREKNQYQLEQALSIPSPWQEDNRECFSSIICLDYNAE